MARGPVLTFQQCPSFFLFGVCLSVPIIIAICNCLFMALRKLLATCTLTEVSKRQLQAHCANWPPARIIIVFHLSKQTVQFRALTPLFGNGAGAHGIGKISGVLTKIGKLDMSLCMKFPLLD